MPAVPPVPMRKNCGSCAEAAEPNATAAAASSVFLNMFIFRTSRVSCDWKRANTIGPPTTMPGAAAGGQVSRRGPSRSFGCLGPEQGQIIRPEPGPVRHQSDSTLPALAGSWPVPSGPAARGSVDMSRPPS
ncbi:hypothetical protein GCM10011392_27610 [Wenxinia marina]|nr:hypothetical protein GCM10011392_27610 [Wenxinia marina]